MDEYSRYHTLHTLGKDEDTNERILQKHGESANRSGAWGAKIQHGWSILVDLVLHEQNKAVLNDNRKSNCLVSIDIEKLVSP